MKPTMQVHDFNTLRPEQVLETDLAIIGAGPAGLTIASELIGSPFRVMVLESGGLVESAEHEALNLVESVGEGRSPAQAERRRSSHSPLAPSWSDAVQPYGLRCRVFGGSTHAWAGKSATFEDMDFETRPWIASSGWPISRGALQPYLDRASDRLNLGPNIYDDAIWSLLGFEAPEPHFDPDRLQAFFWQFSRSRIDQFDAMRFGAEFLLQKADNVQVLLNATATRLIVDPVGKVVTGIDLASPAGSRKRVTCKAVVLAASGIENPRLLLASNQTEAAGLGNRHDNVGRYLIDHPAAPIARFDRAAAPIIVKRFGFQGVPHRGRMHMYMHGLALSPAVKRQEQLPNAALFMLEEHAHDDPFLALKRLMRREHASFATDLATVLSSPVPVIKGLGIKAFQSGKTPMWLKQGLIDAIIKINPNFAVRETLHRGVQFRLLGIRVEGVTEQAPDRDSRITLSGRRDALGVPLAKVAWKIDTSARLALARLAQLLDAEAARTGLPRPVLEPWVVSGDLEQAPVIDMGHMMGTTRMSIEPTQGVVDVNCRVHGVDNLFIAGGSVLPTGSHVNPTLMIVTLATRLADHLKTQASSWSAA